MITPRNPPGRAYLSGNDILFKVSREEFKIPVPKLIRVIRHQYNETLLSESGRPAGIVSWNDEDTLQVSIRNSLYVVDIDDIRAVISQRQTAAPLAETEPGQRILFGVC
jgi:hypothetical protein